jgi:hypothetical protein
MQHHADTKHGPQSMTMPRPYRNKSLSHVNNQPCCCCASTWRAHQRLPALTSLPVIQLVVAGRQPPTRPCQLMFMPHSLLPGSGTRAPVSKHAAHVADKPAALLCCCQHGVCHNPPADPTVVAELVPPPRSGVCCCLLPSRRCRNVQQVPSQHA